MIKKATIEDAKNLAALAAQMWTGHGLKDLENDFRKLVTNDEAACFIKYTDGKPIAFAQRQLRHDYVERTGTSPVGYFEGIFVSEGYRRKGYAAELLSECQRWAAAHLLRSFIKTASWDA